MQVTHYFCDHCGEEITGKAELKYFRLELNACHQAPFQYPQMAYQPQLGAMFSSASPLGMPELGSPEFNIMAQLCEPCYNQALVSLKAVQAWALEKATPEAKD